MSYRKLFAFASVLALASCMDEGTGEPTEPAVPIESESSQAVGLPDCGPDDLPIFITEPLWGTCDSCKIQQNWLSMKASRWAACSQDIEGTKVWVGTVCVPCQDPPIDP